MKVLDDVIRPTMSSASLTLPFTIVCTATKGASESVRCWLKRCSNTASHAGTVPCT